jgi:hypothetical protein
MRLAITSETKPHTKLGIEDVCDTVSRVIGGRSAFFYRGKKPNTVRPRSVAAAPPR